jgi:hypothetical protein
MMDDAELIQFETDRERMMAHLWEIDHPYYCNEGNYFARSADQPHEEYESWADFFEAEGDSDFDMNLLFRWDWRKADPEEKNWGNPTDVLMLYWIGQRKGLYRWTTVRITDADEPAAKAWLAERWAYLKVLWEGIADSAPAQ